MFNDKTNTALIEVQTFEKMHFRLKETVKRYASYLNGTKQYSEDIAQDIFTKLWLKWDWYRNMEFSDLEDVVYAAVRNHVNNERIKNNRKGRKLFRKYLETRRNWYLHDDIIITEGLCLYKQAIDLLTTKEKAVYYITIATIALMKLPRSRTNRNLQYKTN